MSKLYISKRIQQLFFILLVFNLSVINCVNAQTSSYGFTPVTGTSYTEITGGTVVATATGTTGVASLDDIVYNLPNGTIPFNFLVNDTIYTGCNISTNGFITFGSTSVGTNVYTPIASSQAFDAAASFAGTDLIGNYVSVGSALNAQIRYIVTGISPNRIFVVQWKNFKPKSSTTNGINGQIKLYETSNIVELVYNISTAYSGVGVQVGLRGKTNVYPSNINCRLVNSGGLWTNSSNGTANTSNCSLNTTFPPSGLIYRYTPSCFAPYNLGISALQKNSVQVTWSSYVSGTGKIEYGPSGFTIGTGLIVNNATSPATINGLTAGTNYQFYVSTNCSAGGVSVTTGPFNFTTVRIGDDCATAPTITLFTGGPPIAANYTVVSSGITSDGPNALCSDITGRIADDDMWYKFVAPSSVTNKIVITSTAGTNNDWVMEVWNGCVGSGSVVKCSDDVNGGMPEITLCQTEYTPGQVFYVRVWTYGNGASGTMNLAAYVATSKCVIPPVNDECINAITLPIGIPQSCPGSTYSFSTDFATSNVAPNPTIAPPSCFTGGGGVLDEFFKFNTGTKGAFQLTLKPLSAPSVSAELMFDCAGVQLGCYTSTAAGSTYTITGLTDSADYYIRVWSPSGQSGSFEICLAAVCDNSKAVMSGSTGICSGGTAQLKVSLTGIAPWSFTYTDGSTNFNVTTSTSPYLINVSPTVNKTYSLVSLSSPYCSGTVSGSAIISIIQPPTVTLNPFGTICGNATLSLTGGSPTGGAYSGTGVSGGTFIPPTLNAGTYNITYTYGVGSGCARTASQLLTVKVAPSISSFNPGTGPIGSPVTINGSNLATTSQVRFNTTNAIVYSVSNGTKITATVPVGATNGFINVQLADGCSASTSSIFTIGITPLYAILNVRAFIQGFYIGSSHMNPVIDPVNKPNVCDSVTVSLALATAPYSIVASYKGVLSTIGWGAFPFSSALAGNNYYIILNHRNSIETWSALSVYLSTGASNTFDFTKP